MVVHHTGKSTLSHSLTYVFEALINFSSDCGMTHLTDEQIKEDIRKRNPDDAAAAENIDFGCFAESDLEKTIVKDVESLKAEKLLRGVDIRGYVLSTETGRLQEV